MISILIQFAFLNLFTRTRQNLNPRLKRFSDSAQIRSMHTDELFLAVDRIFFGAHHGTRTATRFGRRIKAERLVLLLEIHGNHVCRCDPKIQLLVVSSPPTRDRTRREHSRPSFKLSSKIVKVATRRGNNCKRHAKRDSKTDKCFPLVEIAQKSCNFPAVLGTVNLCYYN